MALETRPWDAAEYLHDEEDLVGYLAVVLQDDEPPSMIGRTIAVAACARGGIAKLATESGVPEETLRAAIDRSDEQSRSVLQDIQNANQRLAARPQVA